MTSTRRVSQSVQEPDYLVIKFNDNNSPSWDGKVADVPAETVERLNQKNADGLEMVVVHWPAGGSVTKWKGVLVGSQPMYGRIGEPTYLPVGGKRKRALSEKAGEVKRQRETILKKSAAKSSSSGHSVTPPLSSVTETSEMVTNQQECHDHAGSPPISEMVESRICNPIHPVGHSASASQLGAQGVSVGEDPIGTTINAATAMQQVTDMTSSLNPSVHPLPCPGETLYPPIFPIGHLQPSFACPPLNSVPWVMIVSPPSVPTSGQPNLETQSASLERVQSLQAEQGLYRGVSDISTLLERLSLEKYQSCFDDEEVDFPTFLVMTDSDLKEIGITTLGARRKLQIAISELKKLQTKQQPGSAATSTANPTYQNLSPHAPGASRGGSLKRAGPASFSHSVRF